MSRTERPLNRSTLIRPPRLLEALAREVYELFPRCVRCGARIGSFEEADVRIFGRRVTHRGACPPAATQPTPAPPA